MNKILTMILSMTFILKNPPTDSNEVIANLILDGKYPEARRSIDNKVEKMTDEELAEDEQLMALSHYLSALEAMDKKERDQGVEWLMQIPYKYSGVLSEEILDYRDGIFTEEEKKKLDEEYAKQVVANINKEYRENNPDIKKQGVRIGMSKEEVLNSNWGKPQKVNKTTTKYGTSEQWVYENGNYLYFEDGILTTIQN